MSKAKHFKTKASSSAIGKPAPSLAQNTTASSKSMNPSIPRPTHSALTDITEEFLRSGKSAISIIGSGLNPKSH